MSYEIDFLPIGPESKGGDAIIIKYGDFSKRENYKIIVIDGGMQSNGEDIIKHIQSYTGDTYIDLVVATHLHSDHIGGLFTVLEQMKVLKLAMHLPWNYGATIKKHCIDQIGERKIETKIEKSLANLSDLEDLARSKNIEIIEPFAGEYITENIQVLGPSKEYYSGLIPHFAKINLNPLEKFFEGVKDASHDVVEWISESMEKESETLSDDYDDTNAENNSSLVLLFTADDGKRFMFTGDAGKESLGDVIKYAEANNINIKNLDFFDVPHHGSKRNLGPTIIEYLSPKISYISCPVKGDPKHPSRKVINCLIRNGSNVHITQGNSIVHKSIDIPMRNGRNTMTPITLFSEVEK